MIREASMSEDVIQHTVERLRPEPSTADSDELRSAYEIGVDDAFAALAPRVVQLAAALAATAVQCDECLAVASWETWDWDGPVMAGCDDHPYEGDMTHAAREINVEARAALALLTPAASDAATDGGGVKDGGHPRVNT